VREKEGEDNEFEGGGGGERTRSAYTIITLVSIEIVVPFERAREVVGLEGVRAEKWPMP